MKMKTTTFTKSLFVLLLGGATILSSCSKDGDKDDDGGDGIEVLADGAVLKGDYSKNIKLEKGKNYTLSGPVHVKPGYTIYIEEGVTVKSERSASTVAYLLIEPGAKIEAEGTATSPIVFTSGEASPKQQDWGGIILCGKAPINVGSGSAASEMGVGVVYGGTDPNDDSGTLRYVRVEYTGKKQSLEAEHNGFTFEGVGAGTTVEYIASYKGGDDGIEFFGGTVNLKYAVVYGAQDDMYDWTFGWVGKGQFWVGVQADDVADRGIEADNNKSDHAANPFSNPVISNVTLVGSATAKTGDDPTTATETGKTRAIKLREATKGSMYNFVIYGFNSGVEVEHDGTLNNMKDGSLTLRNSDLYGPKLWSYKGSDGSTYEGDKPFEAAASKITASATVTPAYITNKYVGINATDAINPTTLGSFFSAASYKGAVQSSDNWVTNGTWARID